MLSLLGATRLIATKITWPILLCAAQMFYVSSSYAAPTPVPPRDSRTPPTDSEPVRHSPISDEELKPQDYSEEPAQQPSARPDAAHRVEVETGPEPDAYLLLPRALLFLPNLALKMAFLPIRKTAEFVDEYHVVAQVEDVLYNDERTMGLLPVLGYQSSYGITGGARAFHNDVLSNQEKLQVSAEYGGLYPDH